ncbi:MAG TPA: hypothetical protein PLU94_10345 [Methanoregulaceae archaeon]|nr:hypothetical protein [Methanoregulaceae archaeon]
MIRGPCSRMQGPSVEGSALPVQALTQAVLAKGRVTLDRLRSRALE